MKKLLVLFLSLNIFLFSKNVTAEIFTLYVGDEKEFQKLSKEGTYNYLKNLKRISDRCLNTGNTPRHLFDCVQESGHIEMEFYRKTASLGVGKKQPKIRYFINKNYNECLNNNIRDIRVTAWGYHEIQDKNYNNNEFRCELVVDKSKNPELFKIMVKNRKGKIYYDNGNLKSWYVDLNKLIEFFGRTRFEFVSIKNNKINTLAKVEPKKKINDQAKIEEEKRKIAEEKKKIEAEKKRIADAQKKQEEEERKKKEEKGKLYIIGSGTGFFVSAQGHIVSNDHVVGICKKVASEINGELKYFNVLKTDQVNDLGLIKGDYKSPSYLSIKSDGAEFGEDIVAFGYPLSDDLSDSVKLTRGIVSSLSGPGNNYSEIQIDAAIQKGNSGGPVMNMDGQVVGVASSGLSKLYILEKNEFIPENVNFAVASSTLSGFLKANGVSITNQKFNIKNTKELAKIGRPATIQLHCMNTKAVFEELKKKKKYSDVLFEKVIDIK